MKPDRSKNSPARYGDEAEPTAGKAEMPVVFVVILAVLIFAGGMFLSSTSGGFNSTVYGQYTSTNELAALASYAPTIIRNRCGDRVGEARAAFTLEINR